MPTSASGTSIPSSSILGDKYAILAFPELVDVSLDCLVVLLGGGLKLAVCPIDMIGHLPELVCDFVSRVDVHREDDELDRLVRILEVVLRQFDCLFDLGL